MSRRRTKIGALVLGLLMAIASLGISPATTQQAQDAQGTPPAAQSAPSKRLSRLQGSAYLSRNDDVIGATVVVQAMENPSSLFLTSTNGKGSFRIEGLPDGDYKVRVERHGVESVVKENVSVRYPFRSVVELPMTAVDGGAVAPASIENDGTAGGGAISLKGSIEDQDQAPLAEAQVRLVRADGQTDPRIATSGSDGSFAIDDFPAGEWMLTVTGVGMLPVRTMLYVRTDGEMEVTLVRQPASYEPSPLELMPPEEPIPPEALKDASTES